MSSDQSTNASTSTAWADAPIAFGWRSPPLPACPGCGSTRPPIITRTEDQGDGSVLRKCVCKESDCGQHYKLVLEPIPAQVLQTIAEDSVPTLASGQLAARSIEHSKAEPLPSITQEPEAEPCECD